MTANNTILQANDDGTLGFGNYTLAHKTKRDDFELAGDIYKVKTFKEMTKLEKNGMFVYESVPGSQVESFKMEVLETSFLLSALEDVQCILELEPNQSYEILIEGLSIGHMTTNVSGKLVISVELVPRQKTLVQIMKRM